MILSTFSRIYFILDKINALVDTMVNQNITMSVVKADQNKVLENQQLYEGLKIKN